MENKQIALIVLLCLIGVFILIMSLKLNSFLKFIDNKRKDGTFYRKFSVYFLEQIIPLKKNSGSQYTYMKLNNDKISYYDDESEQLVYKFQTDENNNWKCCKYLEKDNQITIYDINSNKEYRTQSQSQELIYFSNIQMDQNQTYYYNYKITQQELNNGSIGVLDAYLMYLNHQSWNHFLSNEFRKIQILFLPSNILDLSSRRNSSDEEIQEKIKQKYEEFLFQFQPLHYKIELIYEKVYFTYHCNKNIYFLEIDFQKTDLLLIHRIWCSNKNQELLKISKILGSILLNNPNISTSVCVNHNPVVVENQVPDYYKGCEIAYWYYEFKNPAHTYNAEKVPVQQLKSHIQKEILKV
ncbi:unnamed protein product [Paramecium octaurelia]|uniref:Transmembrane protein n=1 Tax=Paramecium octaurelia TaxID=43137 RepID=A0A8S1XQW6_PAROT|nr:unnamed protein product [Paramecium octaurelia]